MIKKLFKTAAWTFLWLVFFWIFLLAGFPRENAKDWLAGQLERGLNAKVSIEKLQLRWDLEVELIGISINGQQAAEGQEPSAFKVELSSLHIAPKLISLIRFKPEADFNGDTPSGGNFSGSYAVNELSASFKNISFKDVSISALPIPSAATMSGSGKFKMLKGKGTIDIEADGILGGKQRAKVSGGENPGVDGKMKVTVTVPKL